MLWGQDELRKSSPESARPTLGSGLEDYKGVAGPRISAPNRSLQALFPKAGRFFKPGRQSLNFLGPHRPPSISHVSLPRDQNLILQNGVLCLSKKKIGKAVKVGNKVKKGGSADSGQGAKTMRQKIHRTRRQWVNLSRPNLRRRPRGEASVEELQKVNKLEYQEMSPIKKVICQKGESLEPRRHLYQV